VFVFLIVMIACMNAMSAIIDRFFPEPQASAGAVTSAPKDNKKVIAAITAAIKHHRG